jgi:hypothetical protein
MPRPKQDEEPSVSVPYDRDAVTRRALDRMSRENQRLKALVVSLSELVLKNVVGAKRD